MWAGYFACAWTLLFAAPHVWWALGIPTGFPGGAIAYRAAMSSVWFVRYNLFVVVLSAARLLVVLASMMTLGRAVPVVCCPPLPGSEQWC